MGICNTGFSYKINSNYDKSRSTYNSRVLITIQMMLAIGLNNAIPMDGRRSASKPAIRQDTSYMVEKTYHDIALYLGAFGAYLLPH